MRVDAGIEGICEKVEGASKSEANQQSNARPWYVPAHTPNELNRWAIGIYGLR